MVGNLLLYRRTLIMKRAWLLISMGLIFCGLVFSNAILAEGKWSRKADLPVAMGFHSINEVNGKIYVIGGTDKFWFQDPKPFSTVYEYNPKTNIWSNKADMLTPRAWHRSTVIDGKIYVIGGVEKKSVFSNAVEVYDPITDSWEIKTDIPIEKSEFAIGQVNGKIYVIGGHNIPPPAFSTVEEYDPRTDKWAVKSNMPIARTFITGCVADNKIYVFGGSCDNLGLESFSTVEIYDPVTDTWKIGADMPEPRAVLTSCAIDKMIYVMGGTDGSGRVYPTVDIYDTENDEWIKDSDMPVARVSATNYPVIDGKIYVIGGVSSNLSFLSDVWEYKPENLQFAVSSKGKLSTTWGELRK